MHQTSNSTSALPNSVVEDAQRKFMVKPNRVTWRTLAQAMFEAKQLNNIAQTLISLADSAIDQADAQSIAQFCLNNGCLQPAIKRIEEVLNKRPEHDRLWLLLEALYNASGQVEKAKQCFVQFDMINHYNRQLDRAIEAFDKDRLREAEQIARDLLSKIPGELRAMHLMANIAFRFEQFDVAQQIIHNCHQTRPDNRDFLSDYIKIQFSCNNYNDVLVLSEQYAQQFDNNALVQSLKGAALVKLTRYQEARECYQHIVENNPESGIALLRYGNVLKIVGEINQAIDSYKKAITVDSSAAAEGYWNLANLKRYQFTASDICAMDQLAKNNTLPYKQSTFIHFALGKAYEDAQQYADSFSHYAQANHLYKQHLGDVKPLDSNRIKQAYSPATIKTLQQSGHPTDELIFIVGLPRSGSTLIEQILASHPDIDGTMELYEIPTIAKYLAECAARSEKTLADYLLTLKQSEIKNLAQRYLNFIAPLRQGGKYVIDKLPANFEYVGLIKILFPNAKIIDVRREKMAVCWGIYKQFFAQGYQYAYEFGDIANYYHKYIELMNYWHGLFPEQLLTLHYENLIDNFEQSVSQILEYCGITESQACLDFHQNRRPVATPSAEQVRQPIYREGLTNWQHFANFLQPLEKSLSKK